MHLTTRFRLGQRGQGIPCSEDGGALLEGRIGLRCRCTGICSTDAAWSASPFDSRAQEQSGYFLEQSCGLLLRLKGRYKQRVRAQLCRLDVLNYHGAKAGSLTYKDHLRRIMNIGLR
jgi:hypothetical protein